MVHHLSKTNDPTKTPELILLLRDHLALRACVAHTCTFKPFTEPLKTSLHLHDSGVFTRIIQGLGRNSAAKQKQKATKFTSVLWHQLRLLYGDSGTFAGVGNNLNVWRWDDCTCVGTSVSAREIYAEESGQAHTHLEESLRWFIHLWILNMYKTHFWHFSLLLLQYVIFTGDTDGRCFTVLSKSLSNNTINWK